MAAAGFVRVGRSGGTSWHIFDRRPTETGVEGITPHGFQRAYITRLLDARVDLLTVQEVGHSDAATTSRYDRRGVRAR